MQTKSVSAGQGVSWFSCGWNLFKQDFGTWFIMFLILIGISIVLSFIPFIGSLALMIISPALTGGFMYAASEMDKGNKIEIGYLFQGFRDKGRMNKLLVLGGLYLLVQILMMAIMLSLVGGNAMMSAGETGNIDPAAMMSSGTGLSILLVILIGVTVMLGFIYATPLVMLGNMAPVESIKASYSAAFKNILPLLVFGLVFLLLAILAAIPIGLGFLILIPVSMTALYCSYKSIFL
ncbi:MAG: BPSS1780 family membrane protein [Arenicellales bacterium]